MTGLADEVAPVTYDEPVSGLDEFLWTTWKALELPEGYRVETIEGAIEVSPTGRHHMVLVNRLRRLLEELLQGSDHAVWHDGYVIHRRKCWIPDLFVASADLDELPDEEDLGVDAAGVVMVIEVRLAGSPEHRTGPVVSTLAPGFRSMSSSMTSTRRELSSS
jgi:hypothetical protein